MDTNTTADVRPLDGSKPYSAPTGLTDKEVAAAGAVGEKYTPGRKRGLAVDYFTESI